MKHRGFACVIVFLVVVSASFAQELPHSPEDYLGRGVSVRTEGGGSFQGTLTAGTAIVTENWVIWAEGERLDPVTPVTSEDWSGVPLVIAPSAAFRIANNRISWDIGAVVPIIINGDGADGYSLNDPIFPVPVLSLTYRIR